MSKKDADIDFIVTTATRKGKLEILQYLAEVGILWYCTESTEQGFTPMHMAAEEGHIEVLRFLSEQLYTQGIGHYEFLVRDLSLLWVAAGNGQLSMVQYLLE